MNKDELITLARKLYDGGKGISYAKIADKFNTDDVPTVTGKGSWERKMIQRLVSADTLKNAEVKVGMKTEKEVRLESEVESLKSEQQEMLDVISMLRKQNEIMKETLSTEDSMKDDIVSVLESENAEKQKEIDRLNENNAALKRHLADSAGHVNGNLEVIYDQDKKIDSLTVSLDFFKRENVRLESENIGLRSDRDEVLKVFNTVKHENETLKTQRDCFKSESERLNRQLVESESKYKSLYEAEITRLGNELATANQTIQELRDKQEFIRLNTVKHSNFEGWTINNRSDGKGINLVKHIKGKIVAIYLGKTFEPDVAREKIRQKLDKIDSSSSAGIVPDVLQLF